MSNRSCCLVVVMGWLTASGLMGCTGENDKFMMETSGEATAEERAKPVRDYPRTQEEYNKNISPKAPPASYTKAYPFAKGANRNLLAPTPDAETRKSKDTHQ